MKFKIEKIEKINKTKSHFIWRKINNLTNF